MRAMSIVDKFSKLGNKISELDWKKKILVLFFIALLVYGTGIAADMLFLSTNVPHSHYDLPRYRERTQTIIDGDILYRDAATETPPLINYFMVPAQLIGGADHFWIYSAYFSMFAFLTSVMLYLAFRRFDDRKAFLVGVVVTLCPFLISESCMCEDEPIMVFMFLLAAVLMFMDMKKWSAVAIATGIWTKMFSLLLMPTEFLRQKKWKDRFYLVSIVIIITAMVTGPFLILCYNDYSEFLNFYFLGDSNRPTGGQSFWHFLRMGGINLPGKIELSLVLEGLLVTYLYCHVKKLGIWESMTLAMLAFFVLYPKTHTGYYAILFVMLAVWAVENRKVAMRIFAAWLPIVITAGFSQLESGKASIYFDGSWMVGLCLNIIGMLLFIDAARIALKNRPFIYGDKSKPEIKLDAVDER
jgi:4-amino-4-deoxy-L-arabinose transferase-like glycosyltransferase